MLVLLTLLTLSYFVAVALDPAVEEATGPQGRAGAARRRPGARVGRRLASRGDTASRRTSTRVSRRWMPTSPGPPRPKPSDAGASSQPALSTARRSGSSSSTRGGSAPVRPQVMPETAMPNCTASTTACSSHELVATQPVRLPHGQHAAQERVTGTHGVDHRDLRNRHDPLPVLGDDVTSWPPSVSSTTDEPRSRSCWAPPRWSRSGVR